MKDDYRVGVSREKQLEFSSKNITTSRQHFGTEVNDTSDDVNASSSSPLTVGQPAGAWREHSLACASPRSRCGQGESTPTLSQRPARSCDSHARSRPHKDTTCEALLRASELSLRRDRDEGALAVLLAWRHFLGHTHDLHNLLHVSCTQPEGSRTWHRAGLSWHPSQAGGPAGWSRSPREGAVQAAGATYLDHDAGRLREVPERHPEQADERGPGLVGLGAAGAQDAAACKQSASPFQCLTRRFGTGTATPLGDLPEPSLTRTNQPAPHAGPALNVPSSPVSVTGLRLASGARCGPAGTDRPLRRGLSPRLHLRGRQL